MDTIRPVDRRGEPNVVTFIPITIGQQWVVVCVMTEMDEYVVVSTGSVHWGD